MSALRHLDPRAKFGVLLLFLTAVSTTPARSQFTFAGYAALLFIAALLSKVQLKLVLLQSAAVLPFTFVFAGLTWLAGNPQRALLLLERSALSVLATVLLMLSTPLTEIIRALTWARLPQPLALVIQFLHRYLFVIGEEVRAFQRAARSRSGQRGSARTQFAAAAGSLGVLFAKSLQRSEGIHQAMLARGFRGTFPLAASPPFRWQDGALFACSAAFLLALRALA